MIDFGDAPESDEAEVTVFGPGFGEAIAVHLGAGSWILVDSCLDATKKSPAALTYLSSINVPFNNVKAIIASHWHDDHVRGLAKVVEACPAAEVFIPAVFTDDEALAFLVAYSGSAAPRLARGAAELYKVIGMRDVVPAQLRTAVFEQASNGHQVRVSALSPTSQAFQQSVAHFMKYMPQAAGAPITHAPQLKPNLEAVVLHIDLGHDSILLGSDLEEHSNLGWSAVVADNWCGARPKAGIYKVAHHGSRTGHYDLIWTKLLKPKPKSTMTPFHHGKHRLPNVDDVTRIKELSGGAYISSGASRKPDLGSREVLNRLEDICKNLSKVNAGFGAIRLRKKPAETEWRVQLFGEAQAL